MNKYDKTRYRLSNIICNARKRCYNPKTKGYKNYGGRGIKVCDEWMKFENFYNWALTNGYKEGLTIDRINNDGDYCPENCRWIPFREQCVNKRTNVKITAWGETKCVSEWVKDGRSKVKSGSSLMSRINSGHSPEIAISSYRLYCVKKYKCFGEEKSLLAWSEDSRCQVTLNTLKKNIKNNIPILEALQKTERKKFKQKPKYSIEFCDKVKLLYSTGRYTMIDLAYNHGCSEGTISKIVRGRYR